MTLNLNKLITKLNPKFALINSKFLNILFILPFLEFH